MNSKKRTNKPFMHPKTIEQKICTLIYWGRLSLQVKNKLAPHVRFRYGCAVILTTAQNRAHKLQHIFTIKQECGIINGCP